MSSVRRVENVVVKREWMSLVLHRMCFMRPMKTRQVDTYNASVDDSRRREGGPSSRSRGGGGMHMMRMAYRNAQRAQSRKDVSCWPMTMNRKHTFKYITCLPSVIAEVHYTQRS